MKCTKIKRIVLSFDQSELGPEIHGHLESCPECGRFFRRACSCRSLISLKHYKAPSELRREHCLTELHERLATLHQQSNQTFPESVVKMQYVFRYGLAAVAMVLLTLQVVVTQHLPSLRSGISHSDIQSRTFEEFLADRERDANKLFLTFPTFPTNYITASNRQEATSVFFVGERSGVSSTVP